MKIHFRSKRTKNQCKKVHGEVGVEWLDYSEYLLKLDDKQLFALSLKQYRTEFQMAYEKGRMTNSLDLLVYAPLFWDIFNYYNNDICIEVAKFFAMKESTYDYNFKVVMSLVDSLSSRICSCWEYIFQILNKYFFLELNSMALNKEIIDKMYEKKMIFIPQEKGYHVEYVDWSDEERIWVEKEVLKKKKVLNIGKKAKVFLKEIKGQGYAVSERVQQISLLYSQESVEKLKRNVRNTITHKKSATFVYAVGEIDGVFASEGLDMRKEGWITVNEFHNILVDNLKILKEGIQIAYDIVCLGDKLVHVGNENKIYKIVLVECTNCHEYMNMTSELYSIMKDMKDGVVCPKCNGKMKMKSEGVTSEFEHNQVFFRESQAFLRKQDEQEW